MSNLPTYTATVIGAGRAAHLVLDGLIASKRFRPLAVTDISEAALTKVGERYPDLQRFTDHEAMFRACPADVVCVATYAPSHRPLAEAAMAQQRLKGIVVEKPLADRADAGERLLAHIKGQRLPMAVPHGLLFAPHSRDILQRVHRGDIGKLRQVEIQCNGWDISSAGIHWLNFSLALFRHQTAVRAVITGADTTSQTVRDGMQVETAAVTAVEMEDGARIILSTGNDIRRSVDAETVFHLVGSDGFIEFYGWRGSYRILNAEHPRGTVITPAPDGKLGHQRVVEHLAEQMDRGEPDYAVADSALAALSLCEAAFLSHRHRCQVTFPLSRFVPPASTNWEIGRPVARAAQPAAS